MLRTCRSHALRANLRVVLAGSLGARAAVSQAEQYGRRSSIRALVLSSAYPGAALTLRRQGQSLLQPPFLPPGCETAGGPLEGGRLGPSWCTQQRRSFARKKKAKARRNNAAATPTAKTEAADDAADDGTAAEAAEFDLDAHTAKLQLATEALQRKFLALQTGRAVPAMIESIAVVAYEGSASLPINQLGQVLVKDPQTLAVQVYDPSVAGAIVQAINEAGLDLAPRVEGKAVIVPVPKMTKEGRLAVLKSAKTLTEQCRQSVRQTRKQMNAELKKVSESWPKDDVHKTGVMIQDEIDKCNKTVDEILRAKEQDIMHT